MKLEPFQCMLLVLVAVAIIPVSIGRCTEGDTESPLGNKPVFQPNWESLQQYDCPEWFRDAKFGIYAHWGPYSAAEGDKNTDWHSRNMYIPGHANHKRWPSEGKSVTMESVNRENLDGREIRSIQMIGSNDRIAWKLTDGGLQITFPNQKPCEHAFVFKIELD